MSKIEAIKAREFLDSRGYPTVEVEVSIKQGRVKAIVPSGASTGRYEELELRDGGRRYGGMGVLKAVDNVNSIIAGQLKGRNCKRQKDIDKLLIKLDGTKNKNNLGANAILGVSMAVCRAGALAKKIPLYKHIRNLYDSKNKKWLMPVPCFNVINGGKHAESKLDVQEFMIIPRGAPSFKEALRIGSETYHHLKKIIIEKYGKSSGNVGDEGGFAPDLKHMKEGLDLLIRAISDLGYQGRIRIGLDVAASEFFSYDNWRYHFEGKLMTNTEMLEFYKKIVRKYPIVSIEDPFDEDDFDTSALLTKVIKRRIQVVGDDLLVTNVDRIKNAIEKKSVNCLLLKVNQIGTVTEAMEACKLARNNKWNVMVSHRSGDTEDDFIADLVVGLGTGQIKSGAPCRSERLAKYNKLLRIEEELGKKAKYNNSFFLK